MQGNCTSESQEQEQQDDEAVKTKKPPLREGPNHPYQEGIEFCNPSFKLL